jgi:hypothetical protein
MDNLSLLYEKQNLHVNQVRPDLINQILFAENQGNYGRVRELVPYCNDSEKEHLVSEGIYDQLKAKGAGLVGKGQQAIGGAINKAGNYLQNAAANVGATIDPAQNKVAQYGQNLQQQGANAKVNSYKNSAIANLVNDFQKLGINIADMNKFKTDLNTLFDNAINPPAATPPPLPQQAPVPPQAATPQPQMPQVSSVSTRRKKPNPAARTP